MREYTTPPPHSATTVLAASNAAPGGSIWRSLAAQGSTRAQRLPQRCLRGASLCRRAVAVARVSQLIWSLPFARASREAAEAHLAHILAKERQALIDVYTVNELETPEPTKKVNGKAEPVPHYEWEGVVCNNSKCIEKIFFENMTLTQLPKSLFSMNDLKELWLEGNQLEIGKVMHLEILWLKNNKIKKLPSGIGQLRKLRELSVSENALEAQLVPDEMGKWVLKAYPIPEEIGYLEELQRLGLGKNKIQSIPETIGSMKQLRQLSLCDAGMEWLPKEIGSLPELRELWLESNFLKTIPKELGQLKQLTVLFLGNNQLKELPREIGELEHLRELWLENNQLKSLPSSVGGLRQLKQLLLSENKLVQLPDSIKDMQALRYIDIRWNAGFRPEWIADLRAKLPKVKVLY